MSKKIFGILLTAVMVLTSVSVFAAEEGTTVTLPAFESFEVDGNYIFSKFEAGASIVGTENGVEPYSGTKMLKYTDNKTSERKAELGCTNFVLEKNSTYKISFYHYADLNDNTKDGNAPYIYFQCGGGYIRNLNRDFIKQTSAVPEWKKCELFFVTGNDVTTISRFAFTHLANTNGSGTEYFDDLKFEKVDGASISFYTGTVDSRATSELKTKANYYTPETNYKMGEDTLTVYPIAIHGTEVKSVQDAIVNGEKQDIKIATKYTPKKLGERATLLVGIYKNDADGTPVLQKVKLDTWTYNTISGTSTLDTGINYLTVAKDEYDADCYIKAFMVNNFSDLNSISGIVTLPKAQ